MEKGKRKLRGKVYRKSPLSHSHPHPFSFTLFINKILSPTFNFTRAHLSLTTGDPRARRDFSFLPNLKQMKVKVKVK